MNSVRLQLQNVKPFLKRTLKDSEHLHTAIKGVIGVMRIGKNRVARVIAIQRTITLRVIYYFTHRVVRVILCKGQFF